MTASRLDQTLSYLGGSFAVQQAHLQASSEFAATTAEWTRLLMRRLWTFAPVP